jgi:Family of unknown function (DUF6074)
MIEIARLADWLDRLHADRDLNARHFRIAYGLARAANEEGFIAPAALAKVARGDDAAASESFSDVLECLADRGYLEARGNRPKIDGFVIVMSATKTSASITPFPSTRRSGFIRKHARYMATLTPTHSDAYLQQQMRI